MPVLFGALNATVDVVNQLETGMTLPAVGSSMACPNSFEDIVKIPLKFGYDSISGCLMHLSRQELKDFCCTGASGSCLDNSKTSQLRDSLYVNEATGRPYFLNITAG
jgi:hypothetical protein